ncbi:MAG: transposase [Chryseobacterium jejuense]|uniref:transposase n=1 Tax=Chryseobacterium jejuense TaxID=445960 RepID=UPI003D0C4CA0
MNFKDIHIGSLINQRVTECNIEQSRICNFFKCTEADIEEMFLQKTLSTDLVLKWSKLLEYDFFRIYSHHLILYSPQSSVIKFSKSSNEEKSVLPAFRKNIYTKEIIDFMLELINSGKKSKYQIINEYKIPKTTLYKWIEKYRKEQ